MANHILTLHVAGGQVSFAVAISTLRSLRVTALGRADASSPVLAELAAERDWDRIVASVASENAVHRFLEFPFHDRKRLALAVGPALEEHVPLSLDDSVAAHDRAVGTNGAQGRVLAVMAARSAIEQPLANLANDGIMPQRLIWAPSAILEVYARAVDTQSDFVAIDLGDEAAVIGAFEAGQLTALRIVRRTDDEVFVRNVGWSLRTIERLPDRVVAGGSRASDVVGALADSLAGLTVEHLPFDAPIELDPAAAPGWRGLTAPLGLVLAATGKLGVPTIEFPVEAETQADVEEVGGIGRHLAPWAAAAALMGITSTGLDQVRLNMEAGRLQQRADRIYSSAMPGSSSGPGQRVKLELRVSELENLRSEDRSSENHMSPLAILTTMSTVVPAQLEVEFESYDYDPPNVRLRGEGTSFETVTRLQQILDAESGFADVAVSDVRTAADGDGVVFELRFRVPSTPGSRQS